MNETTNFGKNLKAIREFLDMSQTDAANKAGLTTPAICKYEKGLREPQLSSIIKILKVLNVSFERMVKPLVEDKVKELDESL